MLPDSTPSSMRASLLSLSVVSLALLLGVCLGPVRPAHAQTTAPPLSSERAPTSPPQDSLVLTLDTAVQAALADNHDLQLAQYDVREANAQVREAWGNLYPSLDLTGSYTRNLEAANPFAGSGAADLTGGNNQTDWLALNERRRQDENPSTSPISFQEFREQQRQSIEEAGVSFGRGGNPFSVANELRTGLQLTQTLYSKQAFASVRGSQQFKDVSRFARNRQVQTTTNEVVTAFYRALLAQERAQVRRQRVSRAQTALQEMTQQVKSGVLPKAQRLSAQVERSNARTQMTEARNAAALARDNLKRVIGLSPSRPVTLKGDLEKKPNDGLQHISMETLSMSRAVDQALENRPDLQRARLNVELRTIRKEASRAEFFPRVEAVANLNYTGRVPDDRTRVQTDNPNSQAPDPFFFREQQRGFFDGDFWNPSLSVGLQFTWKIFNGFQSSSRLQQAEIQRQRAQTQLDQLRQAVTVEVRRAVRDLETARERIQTQETTVRRAKQNYQHVSERVAEGVARPLELREASDQLDQSRLNYLQAIYDYLVARGDLETALGQPLTSTSASSLMTR
ncbi:MAG: TolC family protein [Bacteroidetes bacterium SW_9_63_38]|nr:MAG: TolC family protein [Bacteroidetes bacterium SW_9_63_38]